MSEELQIPLNTWLAVTIILVTGGVIYSEKIKACLKRMYENIDTDWDRNMRSFLPPSHFHNSLDKLWNEFRSKRAENEELWSEFRSKQTENEEVKERTLKEIEEIQHDVKIIQTVLKMNIETLSALQDSNINLWSEFKTEKTENTNKYALCKEKLKSGSGLDFISLVGWHRSAVLGVSWETVFLPERASRFFSLSEEGTELTIQESGYYEVLIFLTISATDNDLTPFFCLCINGEETSQIRTQMGNPITTLHFFNTLKLKAGDVLSVVVKNGKALKLISREVMNRWKIAYLGSEE